MIANLWGQIDLYCGMHGDKLVPMTLDEAHHPLMYRCSASTPKNECLNVLNIADFQKMMEKISDILLEAELSGSLPSIKNLKWTNKGIIFTVISDEKGRYAIRILNKKAVAQEKPRLRQL